MIGLAGLRGAADAQPWPFYLGFALVRLAPLASLPLVSRTLGPGDFGQYEVAAALVVLTTIAFDAGIGTSVVRFADDERARWPNLIRTAFEVQLTVSLAAACLIAPLQVGLAPGVVDAPQLIAVTVLFALVEGQATVANGILRARARDRLYLRLAVVRLVCTAGLSAVGAVLLGVIGALLGLACGGAPFAAHTLRERFRSHARPDPLMRRRLLRFGMPLTLSTLAMWTLSLSDRLFLQYHVSPVELGEYGANYRIGNVILILLAAPLAFVWVPVAQRAGVEAARQARAWALVFTAAALGVGSLLVIGTAMIVPAVFGADFYGDRLVVALVAASGWLGGLYYLIATPKLMSDSTLVLSLSTLPVVAFALLLNAILIPPMGNHGAALSTLLSYGMLCLVTAAVVRRHRPLLDKVTS